MDVNQILADTKTIAVVGLSNRPDRPSYQVASYMQQAGYKIIPVNPALSDIVLQEIPYPDLFSVSQEHNVDLVNIFRRSETAAEIVDQSILISAKAIWMQLGITNDKAAEKAQAHGLKVIMNRCIMVDHKLWCESQEMLVD